MTGQRREGRLLRRSAEEYARDEVEHGMRRRGRQQVTREEQPDRLGIDYVGHHAREKGRPRGLCRQDERGDVVHMQTGRQARRDPGDDPEERDEEESDKESEQIHRRSRGSRVGERPRCT